MSPALERHAAARAPAARQPQQPSGTIGASSATVLGNWRLIHRIGRGALADVFAAQPLDGPVGHDTTYAVKVLRDEWSGHPTAVNLFRREAAVGAELSHPHLVAVLDAGLRRKPYYLVMPRLYGGTLAQYLAAGYQPPLPVAMWIARQVAQSLEVLHAAGWTHGDVKPGNLFLADDGHATLIDLGFARRNDEMAPLAGRPVIGTLNYIAPELLTSSLAGDIRSDIYSLGVTLYELLTGRVPYEGRSPAEITRLQRSGVPDRLRCFAPLAPREVVHLVRSMISNEPLRRPQTPGELVARLTRLEISTFTDRLAA